MAHHPRSLYALHSTADEPFPYEFPAGSSVAPPASREAHFDGHSLAFYREGRAVTFLLLGGVYVLLALSLNAAGWVKNMDLLLPVVLGALALGTLMAFSRFDSFFMLSHSFATGLAWVFYLMTSLVGEERRVQLFIEHGIAPLQARAYFLLERWLEWMEAALNGQPSNDNYVFILEMGFLIWWLTYLGVWSVFRHGYVWRGVVMAGVALLVNTYYAPSPVTGFLVAYSMVALLLLAWTNLVNQRQRWRAFRIYFSQDIGFDFMRTGFFYTLIVISLAFVAPDLGRNLAFHNIMAPLNQRWEATTQEWNRLYQGLNRQSRAVRAIFGRTLTLSGERNVTDRPIFQVTTAQGRYWRAVTFDRFTGRQWINTATAEANYDAQEPIPAIRWAARRPLTQTVTLLAPTGNVIFAAPDVLQASVPLAGLMQPIFGNGDDGFRPEDGELTWTRSRVDLEVGDSYRIVSNYAEVTVRELREAGTDYPPEIRERYLQLPEDFSSRVAALAAEVMSGPTTVYDRAKQLEQFLRGYEYDDQIPAPGPDDDPLEYFLFDIQRGYCDYYASAMATMLRSQGIPARTASGYAEGTFDSETGTYTITERDAHTWVEVYFPGYGWIEFEPTAGESVLDRPSGAELAESGRIPGMPDDRRPDDQPELDAGQGRLDRLPEEFDTPGGGASALRSRSRWIVLSVLLALAAGSWLLYRRMYQGPNTFAPAPQIFYQRLLDWANRLGLALRPTLTPYERSALFSRHLPLGAPFIRRITEIYVDYRYAPRRIHASVEGSGPELDEQWRKLRPILWRAWLDRRLGRQ